MKAFVYNKKDNKTIAILKDVSCVQSLKDKEEINIIDEHGNLYTFNKKTVKTRIYQN